MLEYDQFPVESYKIIDLWLLFKSVIVQKGMPTTVLLSSTNSVQKLIANSIFTSDLFLKLPSNEFTENLKNLIADILDTYDALLDRTKLKLSEGLQVHLSKLLLSIYFTESSICHGKVLRQLLILLLRLFNYSKSQLSVITLKASLMQIVDDIMSSNGKYFDKQISETLTQLDIIPSFKSVSALRLHIEKIYESKFFLAEATYASLIDSKPISCFLKFPGTFGYCTSCVKPAETFAETTGEPKCHACRSPQNSTNSQLSSTHLSEEKCKQLHLFVISSKLVFLELLKENFDVVIEVIFENMKVTESSLPSMFRPKILSFELLLSIVNNSISSPLRADDYFIEILRNQVCMAILSDGAIIENLFLFELCLSIFIILVIEFRVSLKCQIEVLFTQLYFPLLESPLCCKEIKKLIFTSFCRLCTQPQILVDLYINFDCDLNGENIFERFVADLRVCETDLGSIFNRSTPFSDMERKYNHKLIDDDEIVILKMRSFLYLLQSVQKWYLQKVHADASPLVATIDSTRLSEATGFTIESLVDSKNICDTKVKKEQLKQGLALINSGSNIKMVVAYLCEHGFMENDSPDCFAKFLKTTKGISKMSIGSLLGETSSFLARAMKCYVDLFDFRDISLVASLRILLTSFQLPGEAQKIDRIMEKFADRFCECNPYVFPNADVVYTLSYSIIMLNTDLHSPNVKDKISEDSYVKNFRQLDSEGQTVSEDVLREIYISILNEEILMNESYSQQFGGLTSSSLHEVREEKLMDSKNSNMLIMERRSNSKFKIATMSEHLDPMLRLCLSHVFSSILIIQLRKKVDENLLLLRLAFCSLEEMAVLFIMLKNFDDKLLYLFDYWEYLSAFSSVDTFSIKTAWAYRSLLNFATNPIVVPLLNEQYWTRVLRLISQLERMGCMSLPVDTSVHLRAISRVVEKGTKDVDSSLSTYIIPTDSVFVVPSFGLFKKRLVNLEKIQVLMQELGVLKDSDKLFGQTTSLNMDSLLAFFRAICQTSSEELWEIGLNSKDPGTGDETREISLTRSLQKSLFIPRTFGLQRILEVAYYNIERPRIEWTQIWKILKPHFQSACLHSNLDIATLAIDALRQLSLKFLERTELMHFQTQNYFFQSFLFVFENTMRSCAPLDSNESSVARDHRVFIMDLILSSLEQLIYSKSSNIKSGWRPIFEILKLASVCNSAETLLSQSTRINALRLLRQIRITSLNYVVQNSLPEFIGCLLAFILSKHDPNVFVDEVTLDNDTSYPEALREYGYFCTDLLRDDGTVVICDITSWTLILTGLMKIIQCSSNPAVSEEAIDILFFTLHYLVNLGHIYGSSDKSTDDPIVDTVAFGPPLIATAELNGSHCAIGSHDDTLHEAPPSYIKEALIDDESSYLNMLNVIIFHPVCNSMKEFRPSSLIYFLREWSSFLVSHDAVTHFWFNSWAYAVNEVISSGIAVYDASFVFSTFLFLSTRSITCTLLFDALVTFLKSTLPVALETGSFIGDFKMMTVLCSHHLKFLIFIVDNSTALYSRISSARGFTDNALKSSFTSLTNVLWKSHHFANAFNMDSSRRLAMLTQLGAPFYSSDDFLLVKQEVYSLHAILLLFIEFLNNTKILADADFSKDIPNNLSTLIDVVLDNLTKLLADISDPRKFSLILAYLALSSALFKGLLSLELMRGSSGSHNILPLSVSKELKSILQKLSLRCFELLQVKPSVLNEIHPFSQASALIPVSDTLPVELHDKEEDASKVKSLKELECAIEDFNTAVIAFMRKFQELFVSI